MKLLDSYDQIHLNQSAITIGGYDGIHLGHRMLIRSMVDYGRENDVPSILITFNPSPYIFFKRSHNIGNITLPHERAEILEQIGIDYLITLPFTNELANIPANIFISELIKHLGMNSLWIGVDFSLGKNREGDQKALQKLEQTLNFKLFIIPQLILQNSVVSSTRIRNLIGHGNVKEAACLLGRPYAIENEVIHGARVGHKIGVPTINMMLPSGKLLPPLGVYVTRICVNGVWEKGITAIGIRPTFYQDGDLVIETFIPGKNGNVYGKTAKVELLDFVRPEMKFCSIKELQNQISRDVEYMVQYFQNNPMDSPETASS
jgi:riboflavin kinase/FMN adenylyltransferase